MSQQNVVLMLQQMDYTFGQGGWFRAMDQAVEGLTAQEAAWSPGHGVNSICQTVNHLAFWKEIVAGRLHGAPMSGGRIDNTATFGASEGTWEEAVARLRKAHAAYRAAVAQLTDEALAQPLPGERTPLIDLLQALNVHDGYHLGQIVLLRKAQDAWTAGK